VSRHEAAAAGVGARARARPHAARFVRFALVGGLATALQYAILIALVRGAGMAPTPASSIGFALSASVNYLLNYHFTFRSDRPHAPAALKFAVLAFAGLAINAAIMHVLTGAGLAYLIAQACASGVVLLWNFLGNSAWTFGTLTAERELRSRP
jgi:putative flippase GtrA